MDEEDTKGRIFTVAKQISCQSKAVVGEGCVKDCEGNIVVDQDDVKEVWRKYFDKLSNEEFVWDCNTLGLRMYTLVQPWLSWPVRSSSSSSS